MENIAPLPSRALLRLDGNEVIHFLQNLVTCNVENLENGNATFGALLTPQGKILFDFFILKENGGFVIDVEAGQRDALAKRLTFYKLRADVQISPDDRGVFAQWGGESSIGFADPRLDAMGRRAYGAPDGVNSDKAAWHAHRISLGMPHAGLDFEFGDAFPHEALMDQMETSAGVDFSKGCYVGQEVVSRMQHRGTARNRFVIVEADSELSSDLTGQALKASEKRIGSMGSTSGNHGLALVRVDRATAAISAGDPVLLEGQTVRLAPPQFATFDWAT
ncbi:MAG: folate-binding protein [Rhizobiaceae bacterium]